MSLFNDYEIVTDTPVNAVGDSGPLDYLMVVGGEGLALVGHALVLDTNSLRLGRTDPHWSVAGNRLTFERTYEPLRKHDAELRKLGFSSRH